MNDCPVFRPDHNGECLGCDEWADAHTPEALAAGERASHQPLTDAAVDAFLKTMTATDIQRLSRIRELFNRRTPHAKLAEDCWKLIRAFHDPNDRESDAAMINLIEMACDSAVAAERHTSRAERRKGT